MIIENRQLLNWSANKTVKDMFEGTWRSQSKDLQGYE